ncbi:MAG: hypothetical protein LIO58_04425 [Oscillospiraceae bacterium]|nr:hypothetical protein [Oscillospiraceae bacterium]
MAAKTAAEKTAGAENLVSMRLFRDNARYKDDVFVAVNGKGWLIQRGVDVEVPDYVAEVLTQSMEQDTSAAQLMQQEAELFRQESEKLS